jgi:Fe-S cluster biosynthesis and repair protein YggX
MAKSPYYGPLAETILSSTCEKCWKEWMDASLILLNEYRLNLLDPKHAEIYDRQLLAFLNIPLETMENEGS